MSLDTAITTNEEKKQNLDLRIGLCPHYKICTIYSEISYDCNISRQQVIIRNRIICYSDAKN